MASPLLPPRGIFIPTHLIFHPDLPSAVLVTWIRLRCLTWDGWTTPPMKIIELAAHIGIHHTRLHRHLAQLQDISALSWRITSQGKVILSFPEEPIVKADNLNDGQKSTAYTILNTEDRETPVPSSYFPPKILGYLSFDDDDEGFLNVKEDTTNMEAEGKKAEMNFPFPEHHASAPHTILLKQPSHEKQKGSHAQA